EAQSVVRLGVEDKVRIKVRGIRAPDTQDTTTFGGPHCRPPALGGTRQSPGRQRDTGCQASLEQMATTQTYTVAGMGRVHTGSLPVFGRYSAPRKVLAAMIPLRTGGWKGDEGFDLNATLDNVTLKCHVYRKTLREAVYGPGQEGRALLWDRRTGGVGRGNASYRTLLRPAWAPAQAARVG